MMTYAYNPIYLNRAARVVGNMLHNAVKIYNYRGSEFLHLFIQSGIAEQIEECNPKYIAGMSGEELFLEVMSYTVDYKMGNMLIETYERSDVYWVGWILTYYQWYSKKRFRDILEVISYDDFIVLYERLHEMDIRKIYEILDEHFSDCVSKLKLVRGQCGITQEKLSEISGVSLNTIRAYERNAKDIRKAQTDIVFSLARALKCDIRDIV